MYKAKFFRVATSLDARAWKRFRKFVHLNPGNRSEKVGYFLDQVYPAHPEFNAAWIERKALHTRVFPELPYKDQRLFDHLSYLYDLLEQFLLMENRGQVPIADELTLAACFRGSGMIRDFQQVVKKARKKLSVMPEGAAKALAAYRLASEEEALFSGQLKEQSRTNEDGLQTKMDALELHFLRVRFQYSCEMLNRQNVIGTSYDMATLEQAIQMYEIRPEKYSSDPVIGAYYQVLRMFLHPEDLQSYQDLRALLESQSENLPVDEARSLYAYAQNYCIRRVNQGEEEYHGFLFDLYMEMLERGSLFEDERLSQWDYKNIVSLGLRLGKTAWVSDFIESQRERIAPDYQENAYGYNRAYFDYANGSYSAALRRLQQVEFSDVFYHLGTKAIQMKIYYELEETEALISLFATFKTYLRRHKGISTYQRETHLNLVRYLERLNRLRERSGRVKKEPLQTELNRLRNAVDEADGVSNLQWLVGQIEALEET